MTSPEEKAIEIYDRMKGFRVKNSHRKKCAIECVKEVINQWEYIDTYLANLGGELNPNLRYWQEVLTETEKL